MREIKFRAWSYENNKMIEVGQLDFFMDGEIHINEELPTQFQGKKLYEIMQFTGLKDKNGKPIYEGDQVKCINKYDEEFLLEVKWVNHLAGWYYVDKTCKEGEWISPLGMFDLGEEVVGNIYEDLQNSSEGDII